MRKHDKADPGALDVVWAIVLIQGAITILTGVEAVIGSLAMGVIVPAAPIILLSFGGGALALASARGIRRGRSWARRVTRIAEYLVLASGILTVLGSVLLDRRLPGVTSLSVSVIAPLTVIVLLRRNIASFTSAPAELVAS